MLADTPWIVGDLKDLADAVILGRDLDENDPLPDTSCRYNDLSRTKGDDVRYSRMALLALFLVALVVPSTVAAAGPPLDIEMEAPTGFFVLGDPDGTFTATGPAVAEGLVCESGETILLDGSATGWQSNRLFNFKVLKEFVCDDGSGSFFVKLEVHYDFAATPEYNEFNWTIKGGTGDYEDLHGSGSGMGLYADPATPPDGVLDTYEGKVH